MMWIEVYFPKGRPAKRHTAIPRKGYFLYPAYHRSLSMFNHTVAIFAMELLRGIFLTGLLAFFSTSTVDADDGRYRLKAGFRTVQLVGKFRYVQRNSPLVITQIDSALLNQLKPVSSAIPIFRDRENWYYVYFQLMNESPTTLNAFLQIDNPIIDSLQVFICDRVRCQSFPMESVVDPARQTIGRNLRHQYSVTLAPGEEYAVFVSITNRLSFQRLRLPIQLTESSYHPTFEFLRGLFEKVYVGTLFFVILFTLLSLFFFRERVYLYYLTYLVGLATFFVSRENYLAYFSSENQFFFNTWLVLGIAYTLMFVGYTSFAQAFLNARAFAPNWLLTFVNALKKAFILSIALFFTELIAGQSMRWLTPVVLVIISLSMIAIWLFAYFAFRHHYKPAYLFSTGFFPVFVYAFIIDPANELGYFGSNLIQLFYSAHIVELFMLTSGLVFRFKTTQTEKETLQREIVEQRQTQLETIIQTQETERQRIATDLHDDLGGTLATIRRRINDIRLHLHDPRAAHQLDDLRPLIQKSNDDLRRIAHNLMPPEFARIGLCAALQQLVRGQPPQPTRFNFITSGTEHKLPVDIELNAYRIVSELVQNINKHAQADRAAVQLLYHDDHLTITVDDDGIGSRAVKTGGGNAGIGLKNSSLRAEYIGANLWCEVSEGGTLIVLDVPYPTTSDVVRRPNPDPAD